MTAEQLDAIEAEYAIRSDYDACTIRQLIDEVRRLMGIAQNPPIAVRGENLTPEVRIKLPPIGG